MEDLFYIGLVAGILIGLLFSVGFFMYQQYCIVKKIKSVIPEPVRSELKAWVNMNPGECFVKDKIEFLKSLDDKIKSIQYIRGFGYYKIEYQETRYNKLTGIIEYHADEHEAFRRIIWKKKEREHSDVQMIYPVYTSDLEKLKQGGYGNIIW